MVEAILNKIVMETSMNEFENSAHRTKTDQNPYTAFHFLEILLPKMHTQHLNFYKVKGMSLHVNVHTFFTTLWTDKIEKRNRDKVTRIDGTSICKDQYAVVGTASTLPIPQSAITAITAISLTFLLVLPLSAREIRWGKSPFSLHVHSYLFFTYTFSMFSQRTIIAFCYLLILVPCSQQQPSWLSVLYLYFMIHVLNIKPS